MNHRTERVSEVLKRELGVIILRELDFAAVLVTISAVDITPDLKQAHVYVSALGSPDQQRAVLEKLEKARAHLQSEVAKRLPLKYTPHLHFKIDEAIERGTRVLGIMNELGLDENV
ncbi:MAG: 30S ribosome-binding factor RbfA [Verrucomicrobiae bacterium]